VDWKKLIEQALRERQAIEEQRSGYVAEQRSLVDGLAEGASLTETQQARFDELSKLKRTAGERLDSVDERLTELRKEQADDERLTRAAAEANPGAPAPSGGTQHARTVARDETYSPRSAARGVSFFTDLYRRQMGLAGEEVQARLQAHEGEVRDAGRLSARAVATGGLGGLVPPQYLVDDFAAVARAGRPTANIVRGMPLPATGQTITIPRGTTGTSTAVQATQNTNVSSTDYAVTDLTFPVVTISGQQDVSRQSIERGEGVDTIIYADLAASYAVSLDQQVLYGTGSSGQMLGITKTAGITQLSAFSAPANAATFYSKVAGAIAAVGTGRLLAASGIIMHPNRWGWLSSLVDGSNRPLAVPNPNGPNNAVAVYNQPENAADTVPVGWMQGLPIFTDANLPTNVGTGPEDQVIVARLADSLLYEEGDGQPTELRFEQTLGNQLTIKIVAYGYAAFTAGRYPLATALVGGNAGAGNGLVAPTF
jgi:HK97 family phage major capsid protein